MNILFCSYFNTKNKEQLDEFLGNTEYFINMEMIYSFFQLVKVLGFMNMEYRQLYEKTDISQMVRNTMYKEDTNVLSYYVITLILIYNYQSFLGWCKTNNTELLQFKKSPGSQKSFCDFIEKKYRAPKMLKAIDCSDAFFKKIKNKTNKKEKSSNSLFLTNNLRMTICEFG
jgi:heme/copper-type cytochrome/quinol oxidase subunit 1